MLKILKTLSDDLGKQRESFWNKSLKRWKTCSRFNQNSLLLLLLNQTIIRHSKLLTLHLLRLQNTTNHLID